MLSRRNGTASPIENTVSRVAPSATLEELLARTRTLASMEPTQGVQPTPNDAPISAELKYPLPPDIENNLLCLSNIGSEGRTLSVYIPKPIIMMPPILESHIWKVPSCCPTNASAEPIRMKIDAKPRTKSNA